MMPRLLKNLTNKKGIGACMRCTDLDYKVLTNHKDEEKS